MRYLLILMIPLGLCADFGMRTRGEMLWKYQNLDFDLQDYVLTGRVEKAFVLPQKWQGAVRAEFPYIWLWGKREEVIELDGSGIIAEAPAPSIISHMIPFTQQGFGDMSAKAFFTTPNWSGVTWGFGSDFTFPTAQKIELGTGKYAAHPILGGKYDLPSLGSGASLIFYTKYLFSFAGNENRPSYRVFTIQPICILRFYETWAFSLGSESQLDCKELKWFVPISITLGKAVREKFTFSAQYQRGIVTDFPIFQDEVEVTGSFLF